MARQHKTQRSLGELLTMSPATTTRRLSGSIAFSIEELTKVAEWLGVPMGSLLEDRRIAS